MCWVTLFMLNRYIIDLIFSLSTARHPFMFHKNIQREKIYTIESGYKACFFYCPIYGSSQMKFYFHLIYMVYYRRERGGLFWISRYNIALSTTKNAWDPIWTASKWVQVHVMAYTQKTNVCLFNRLIRFLAGFLRERISIPHTYLN